VKGKTEATRIFALLGDNELKQSENFIQLSQKHAEFLDRYRAQDWNKAESLAAECQKLNTINLNHLYALYRERIAYFRMNPPPAHWDGTAEALSK
jgi:adenylate cyclase